VPEALAEIDAKYYNIMKNIFFGLILTFLLPFSNFAQDKKLLEYTDLFLKNQVEVINLLSKNKDLKLDANFVKNLQDCKSEEEINNLFLKNNIRNSLDLIQQINNGVELTNNFKKGNQDFYKNDQETINNLFNEAIEISLSNTDFNVEMTSPSAKLDCYSAWRKAVGRCNRNFAIQGAGAVLAAGLTSGIGGLIGGEIACVNLWNCKSDALEDYNDCIGG